MGVRRGATARGLRRDDIAVVAPTGAPLLLGMALAWPEDTLPPAAALVRDVVAARRSGA